MTQNSGHHFFLMHDFLEHCAQVLGMLVISGLLLIQVMQDVLGSKKSLVLVFVTYHFKNKPQYGLLVFCNLIPSD